ncbi:MAG TPA: class I tRNA ligase family protein, partial [Gemmatimonadaceae bacterium]|nr:class I tRNA ligase family protein [Gemmatimonadaceae bacterium]
PDIIFFWVSRMIMAGYQFVGRAPYHTVLLHGMARDAQGRKMSKSLGNGVDPMEVVRLYGADAMRWTLVSGMGLGADITLDPNDLEKTFAVGRNFVTKLWNIGRFLLDKAGSGAVTSIDQIHPNQLQRADAWILWRLDEAIEACDAALGPLRPTTPLSTPDQIRWTEEERRLGMRLNDFAEVARGFVWGDLADWYVEAIKGRLAEGGDDAQVARSVLVHIFDNALRLLHPVIPFVTEAIWQQLPSHEEGTYLATASWPETSNVAPQPGAAEFERMREVVGALRQIRAEYSVPPSTHIRAYGSRLGDIFKVSDSGEATSIVERLARAQVSMDAPPPGAAAHAVLSAGATVTVPLAGLVDVEKECAKLRAELASLEKQLVALESRLGNEKFVAKAPEDVVAGERRKLEEWSARRDQLRDKVQTLCGG